MGTPWVSSKYMEMIAQRVTSARTQVWGQDSGPSAVLCVVPAALTQGRACDTQKQRSTVSDRYQWLAILLHAAYCEAAPSIAGSTSGAIGCQFLSVSQHAPCRNVI